MHRSSSLVSIAAAISLLASCRSAPKANTPAPAIAEIHGHADGCGHVFENGLWRAIPDAHAHGPACGHVLSNGEWRFFSDEHRHRDGCGHFLVDGAWQPFPKEHAHGEGCGHYFRDDMWSAFARGHLHDAACGHLLADGEWTSPASDPGHEHAPGCGHRFLADGTWVALASAATPSSPPRGFVHGQFRHGGGYQTIPRGSRCDWRVGGAPSTETRLTERASESALGGSPVESRD